MQIIRYGNKGTPTPNGHLVRYDSYIAHVGQLTSALKTERELKTATITSLQERLNKLEGEVRYFLDNTPEAVRVHEGDSAEENLAASLAITVSKLKQK